eukprot:CAMPEP_0197665964 /NCGR_PEP_ID=MMETSP1338-20131121/61037_1 /TAXON_ID=43686 ORGANISM="Pelagodinium beii, Strain RCC1491" /NCGR_SAMPLE_ID=MMETSP1338 /ASSEMBLY_ACC=CAM_ASM_000754 /LENGTH=46 /DNA_ID= /DNA_START= /DNA_END= /DNA_ORIENTATION=
MSDATSMDLAAPFSLMQPSMNSSCSKEASSSISRSLKSLQASSGSN